MHTDSFNISVQGASHIKKNKVCQDSSESYNAEGISIAIVCDGHGGDDYVRSDVGSKIAASVAKENILTFAMNTSREDIIRNSDRLLRNLEASIIAGWNAAISEHCAKTPFTELEISVLSEKAKKKYLSENKIESAYGTTLLAVVFTQDYWFGMQIGDGKCVSVSRDGTFSQPIPKNDRNFLNVTTSICGADALEDFRHFFSTDIPAAAFVGSDGIDDCFKTDDQLYNLYKTVMYSFNTSNHDTAEKGLEEYLPRLSAKGSGDDVSIAAVLDMDAIGEIDSVKSFDREKEKARVEEHARLEAQKAEAERKRVEAERARQAEEAKFRKQREEWHKLEAELKQRAISAERRAQIAEQRADEAIRKEQQARNQLDRYTNVRRCRNCGSVLSPTAKFCPNCSYRTELAPPLFTAGNEAAMTSTPDAPAPEQINHTPENDERVLANRKEQNIDVAVPDNAQPVQPDTPPAPTVQTVPDEPQEPTAVTAPETVPDSAPEETPAEPPAPDAKPLPANETQDDARQDEQSLWG